MATDHVFSQKEVGLMRECPRKWAAKYLHKCPDPKHPAAQDGIDMHNLLEKMLNEGVQSNTEPESKVGSWARALYPLTPPGSLSEMYQTFDLFGRLSSFKLDFLTPDFTEIGDYKSGRKGSPWTLTDETINDDLQSNLFSYGFMKVAQLKEVGARWLYVDKRTSTPWTVLGRFEFAKCEDWLGENALPYIEMIEAMRGMSTPPPLHSIPLDITACGGKGRNCNFWGACQFRPAPLDTQQLVQLTPSWQARHGGKT